MESSSALSRREKLKLYQASKQQQQQQQSQCPKDKENVGNKRTAAPTAAKVSVTSQKATTLTRKSSTLQQLGNKGHGTERHATKNAPVSVEVTECTQKGTQETQRGVQKVSEREDKSKEEIPESEQPQEARPEAKSEAKSLNVRHFVPKSQSQAPRSAPIQVEEVPAESESRSDPRNVFKVWHQTDNKLELSQLSQLSRFFFHIPFCFSFLFTYLGCSCWSSEAIIRRPNCPQHQQHQHQDRTFKQYSRTGRRQGKVSHSTTRESIFPSLRLIDFRRFSRPTQEDSKGCCCASWYDKFISHNKEGKNPNHT